MILAGSLPRLNVRFATTRSNTKIQVWHSTRVHVGRLRVLYYYQVSMPIIRIWLNLCRYAGKAITLGNSVRLFITTVIIVGLVGCHPMLKYQMLSIFFDGVPPPGMPDKNHDTVIRKNLVKRTVTKKSIIRTVSVHQPYAKRQCDACHSDTLGYATSAQVDGCRKCHEKHYYYQWNDWAHGPVFNFKCVRCHHPHESKNRSLLLTPMPDICFDCHDKTGTMAGSHHTGIDPSRCGMCHDPHSAGNRFLLVDSTTLMRRKSTQVASGHSKWSRDQCKTCHIKDKSFLVVDDVDRECVNCHKKLDDGKYYTESILGIEKIQFQSPSPLQQLTVDWWRIKERENYILVAEDGDYAGKIHKPVSEGKCTSCHAPHGSSRPSLIKPRAEQNCIPCHPVNKLKKESHSGFYRVECLLCHRGHHSKRKKLLRSGPWITETEEKSSSPIQSTGTDKESP